MKLYRIAIIQKDTIVGLFAVAAKNLEHAVDQGFSYADTMFRQSEGTELFMLNNEGHWALFKQSDINFNGHYIFNPFDGHTYGQGWTVVA